ncbi:MAG: hypothetical protein JWL59_2227 [Chthoniobacteraceae bacterium]|nr:hypothetical protein [Chthoniobacteraceae bacterium]
MASAGALALFLHEFHKPKIGNEGLKAGPGESAVEAEAGFDFGRARSGAEISHEFVIRNPGAERLKILRVESSCSCLSIVKFPSEIEAGETGSVKLLYRAPAPGVARAEVLVETNRANRRLIQFQWKGLVSNPRLKQEVPVASYISMAEMEALRSNGSAPVLLDVRPRAKFERLSIPGAMHFPPHLLKTLGFLNGKQVILIAEGHQDGELLKEITQLESRGAASVRILAGGLRAWTRAGKALSGSLSEMAEVMTIPPSQFDEWTIESGWRIVQASAHQVKGAAGMTGAKILIYDPAWTKEQWKESLAPLLAGMSASEQLLFVTDHGEHYRTIEEAGASANAFYLEGGLAGFNKWERFQAAMRDSKTVTMAASGSGSAPGSVNVVRGSAGCATCPGKR